MLSSICNVCEEGKRVNNMYTVVHLKLMMLAVRPDRKE